MRALVMEIKKNKMVVMNTSGEFIKIPSIKGAKIGEEINVQEQPKMIQSLYRYTAAAAACILILIGGIQVKAYYSPYGYTTLDINPSIELKYNKFERIIEANGLNNDGKKVISETENLKNNKLGEGIEKLIKKADSDNYLKSDTENNIVLAVYAPDQEKSTKIKEKLNNSINNYLSSNSKKIEVMNEVVSKEDIQTAKGQNISVGKLLLYTKAKDAKVDLTIDDVRSKPVRDIVKLIKDKTKEQKESSDKKDNKDDKNSSLIKHAEGNPPTTPMEPSTTDNKEKLDKAFEKADPEVKKPEIGTSTKPVTKNPVSEKQDKKTNDNKLLKEGIGSSDVKQNISTSDIEEPKTNNSLKERIDNRIKNINDKINTIKGKTSSGKK